MYEKVENVPPDDILLKYYYKETYESIESDGKYRKEGNYHLKYHPEWMKKTYYKDQPEREIDIKIIDINKVPEEIRHLFIYSR